MTSKTPKLHSISASQFLLCLFEHYHEGVFITDQNGVLIYYNQAMAKIDGLDHRRVTGCSITEIYLLDSSQSVTLTALRLSRPIINRPHIYRTANGKLVNSISSAYPLFDNNALVGAICVVVDYSSLLGNFSQSRVKTRDLPKAPETTISFNSLIGGNESMKSAVDMARRASATPSSVMLIGETGTGKELFAQAIHHGGPRSAGPFMAINCAAIPSALLEAILFGTAKGAFTGAIEKAGLFELANGGTIFLDELSAMPFELQPKLLRALQDRRVRRIGSSRETAIDVKIISAVNNSPFQAIEQGLLRADLFYRLGVVMVHLPPLRERRDDIEPLLNHFMKKFNKRLELRVQGFSPGASRLLLDHSWPGNVRELEHAVEAAMNIIDPSETHINLKHLAAALPPGKFSAAPLPQTARPDQVYGALNGPPPFRGFNGLPELAALGGGYRPPARPADDEEDDFADEIAGLSVALRRSRGNVARAAKCLGYSPQRLHYRLKKFGLISSDFKR